MHRWRRGPVVRGVVLLVVAAGAIYSEMVMAPQIWEMISYAQSYADGHVRGGGWTQEQAARLVIERTITALAVPAVIALCPLLLGYLLSRWD